MRQKSLNGFGCYLHVSMVHGLGVSSPGPAALTATFNLTQIKNRYQDKADGI